MEIFRQIFLTSRYRNSANSSYNSQEEAHSTPSLESKLSEQSYLLLLHEDYPCELEVFSPDTYCKDGTGVDDDGHVQVFCALGCVRDASDLETAAILAAAKSLNIVCVGANLGMNVSSPLVTCMYVCMYVLYMYAFS